MSGTMIFAAVCGLPIGLILLFKIDICYFPVLFCDKVRSSKNYGF